MDLRSPLAAIVFGDDIDPDRDADEGRLIAALSRWMGRVGRSEIHAYAAAIDTNVGARLSAPNVLRLAQDLDARSPEILQSMPTLTIHLEVLSVADRAARFFSRENIECLRAALADEGDV
jgi:hypothetical protein